MSLLTQFGTNKHGIKRRNKIEQNIRQFREGVRFDRQLQENMEMDQFEMEQHTKLESYGSVDNRKREERRKRLLAEVTANDFARQLFLEQVSDIYIESLVMDDYYVNVYREQLRSESMYMLNLLFSESNLGPDLNDLVINSKNNYLVDMLAESIDAAYQVINEDNADEVITDPEAQKNAEEEAKAKLKNTNNQTDRRPSITREIQDKVTDVIINEKRIAERNKREMEQIEKATTDEGETTMPKAVDDNNEMESLEESSLGFKLRNVYSKDSPSLFKSMMNKHAKTLMSESTNSADVNMDDALVKSVKEYTFLETLNTLRLIEFDRNLADNITSLYKY